MPLRLVGLHQRRASSGIAEDDERGGPERETDCGRACGMVDGREDGQPLGPDGGIVAFIVSYGESCSGS